MIVGSRAVGIGNAFSSHVQIAEVEEQLEEAQRRIADLEALNRKLRAVSEQQVDPSSPQEVSLSIQQVVRDPDQVRRYFDPVKLASLTASIKEIGIRERLWVRRLSDDQYLLIAGERRYRAAIDAGLIEVPVVVLNVDDKAALKLSLIENLQREDLSAVEEAEGILKLLSLQIGCTAQDVVALLNRKAYLDKKGEPLDEITENVFRNQWQTVEQLFEVLGRFTPESFRVSRLPLLNLPEEIQLALRQGQLEYTKARAIARVKDVADRQELLETAIEKDMSLSEIQTQIRDLQPAATPALKSRFKAISNRLMRLPASEWDNPKKSKKLMNLLNQLEALMTS
jgi:ParB family chromosome partitioning protein